MKKRTYVKNKVMKTTSIKDERIEVRVSAHDKRLFKRAQELSGDSSFSSFIVRILKKQTAAIVGKNDRILSSEKDRQIFFDAVFGVAEPNPVLKEATQKYAEAKPYSRPLLYWKSTTTVLYL